MAEKTSEVAVRGTVQAPVDRVLTVPNALSALRILGVPVFLWLILRADDGWALAVLVLSGATDYLDGKIARRYHLVSRIGALLDPVADRLYILAALIGLAARQILPWWLVGILLGREVFMSVVLLVMRQRGIGPPPVHLLGKAATFNLLYAFPLLLVGAGDSGVAEVSLIVGWGFVWWGTALYWVAGGIYAGQAGRLLRSMRVAAS